ncbi:cartilage-associated protein-like [Hermetia illucens]|uniref:cartilage-associated protein-like n=1 Tax=Hermetia illucens TaxID=343691 RepID=UPI0018CC22B4|nr:cartilage-associated protein-like [Hermetia illucens]
MEYSRIIFALQFVFVFLVCLFQRASNSVTSKSDYFQKIILDRNQPKTQDAESIKAAEEEIKFDPNFLDLYHSGVQAYLENDWEACINHIQRSLSLYRNYYEAVANCRVQCEFERERFKNTHKEDYDHIHFFEKLIVKTVCLEKCRQINLSYLPRYFTLDYSNKQIFKTRKPYEYLQLCYYREGDLEKAISATYTALVANPGDDLMKKNMEYYTQQKEFDWDKLRDMEDKRFSTYYQDGVDKYEQKQWKESIELLEIAMDTWLQEHDKCRAFCESEFDQGWFPDFTASVANHYVFTLRCKQNCTNELSFVNGRFYEDLYPSMFNYLQFAYYNIGKLVEASQCAASYLLFYPDHEEMLNNVEYYKEAYKGKSKKFLKPRQTATNFVQRFIYEVDFLNYVEREFSQLSNEPFRPRPQVDILTDHQIIDAGNSNLITENERK